MIEFALLALLLVRKYLPHNLFRSLALNPLAALSGRTGVIVLGCSKKSSLEPRRVGRLDFTGLRN